MTGEAIVAYVTLKGGARGSVEKLEELRNHVAKKIGPIAKPANIVFTPELPKTRSGKIMRRLLRDVAENRPLGDTTTLADPAVVAEIQERATAETVRRRLRTQRSRTASRRSDSRTLATAVAVERRKTSSRTRTCDRSIRSRPCTGGDLRAIYGERAAADAPATTATTAALAHARRSTVLVGTRGGLRSSASQARPSATIGPA